MSDLLIRRWSPSELEVMQNRAAETSLHFFVRLMWSVLEPATPFADGWWPKAWCQHLEAVEDGRITRIVANVPPGASKSILTNCFYPAWVWGPLGRPFTRFLSVSYSQTITERDNERMRLLIQSDEYQRRWGGGFKANDSKILFANDKTGFKLATSSGGSVTGLRADRVILDDPDDLKSVDSTTIRENTHRFLQEVLPTRLNNLETSAIILIQQRSHEEDSTGFLLNPKRGGDRWTLVMCPMTYDPDWTCGETVIGWRDPRTERGELFWPERFSAQVVADLRETMTDYAWHSQCQQAPEPRGGAIIKRDWWKLYGHPDEDPQRVRLKFPPFSFLVASLDSALTDKTENDPSAMVVLGVWTVPETGEQAVMVVNCWAERLQFHDLVTRVAATCDKYRVNLLLIENKANGHSVEQELRRMYQRASWGVIFTDPTRMGEKVARVHSVTHLFQEGMVWAPNTGWADDLRDECAIFPRGSHDDRCFVAGTLIQMADGTALPIERIAVGALVATPQGPAAVTAAGCTGHAETWRLTFDGGDLEGTADHPILTNDVWTPLCEVVNGAILHRWHFRENQVSTSRSLCSMAIGIAGILTQRLRRIGATSRGLASSCIERSGSIITALFLTDTMSITSMATGQTTGSRTLSVWPATSTLGCTSKLHENTGRLRCNARILQLFGLLPRLGTLLRRGLRGIVRTAKADPAGVVREDPLPFAARQRAWNVELCSHPSDLTMPAIARQNAMRRLPVEGSRLLGVLVPLPALPFLTRSARNVGRLMSSAQFHAKSAEPPSLLRSLEGRSSVPPDAKPLTATGDARPTGQRKPVYNLTVADAHCYYANGVLVHNCDALVQALRYLRDNGILYTRREERWHQTELAELARGTTQRERPLYAA